jgi:pimeloyl-ACP methyl ester carboxylesterase
MQINEPRHSRRPDDGSRARGLTATYMLVHGAWHGGWAWTGVADRLRARGHHALNPTLPGHGSPSAPPGQVTMSRYVESVVDLVDRQTHPVVLVGHSMAGAVISRAAELRPEKVASLVYVAAFLLASGESVLRAMQADADGQVLPRLRFNEDGTGALVDRDTVRSHIYNETPDEIFEQAWPLLLESQPTQPLSEAVFVTPERFGRIRRVFVKTRRDRLLSPSAQQRAIDANGCDQVLELDADHVPFFSRPDDLAAILDSLVGGFSMELASVAAEVSG